MKKLISLTLCLCLLCSVLAVSATADHVCTDSDGDGWCDSCWECLPHFCCTSDGNADCDICFEEMEHTCVYFDNAIRCEKCRKTKPDHICQDNDNNCRCDECYSTIEHTCVDDDADYWCDLCGWGIEHDCVDNDDDMWCDLCNDEIFHDCIDTDGDYICEICYWPVPHDCVDTDKDEWCDLCDDPVIEFSYPCITGTAKGGLDELDPIYIDVFDEYGELINFAILSGNSADYELDAYGNTTHTVVVSKSNHTTRTYSLYVEYDAVELDVVLCPIGDASGDGKITVGDTAKIYAHVRGTSILTDDYALKCADVSGDSKYTVGDTAKLYAHIRGTAPLW